MSRLMLKVTSRRRSPSILPTVLTASLFTQIVESALRSEAGIPESAVRLTIREQEIVGLISEDGSMNRYQLTDYMVANIQDIISRTEGVGEVTVFGSQNAMRIWIDPTKLNNYRMTTNDVIAALQSQNAQVSAGQFGGAVVAADRVDAAAEPGVPQD